MNYSSLSVMVVEDHGFQRKFAARLLQELGIGHVYQAGDGHEALALLRRNRVDLVLCDLQMPGMDGIEFIRNVGQLRLPLSFVFLSSLELSLIATVANMASAYNLKVFGTLEKPLRPEPLARILSMFMEHLLQLARNSKTHSQPAWPKFTPEEVRRGLLAGEFVPWFQPKISFCQRKLVGVEALARWQHPELGMLPPAAFIQVAEEREDIIGLLGDIMLERSLEACGQWLKQGSAVMLSLNLSALSLNDPELVGRLCESLDRFQVIPQLIIIEITESMLIGNWAQSLETLARLRLRGFGLSIDDFGTGYSSMHHLSHIPFTELKIDRSFVQEAEINPQMRVIIEATIDLARRLKLKTVAEGVERQEDWDFLSELGCDLCQGYLIARPMPGPALMDWAAKFQSQNQTESMALGS
jgi:EAL domain-containing protein (putative c-di-GMP-specific phosphodiesterase class I)/CheY-like chemotaxis protein